MTVLGFDVMDSFSLPLCTRYCKQPSGVTTTSAFVPAPPSMLSTTCAQIASHQDNSRFPQRQQTTYNATQRIRLRAREDRTMQTRVLPMDWLHQNRALVVIVLCTRTDASAFVSTESTRSFSGSPRGSALPCIGSTRSQQKTENPSVFSNGHSGASCNELYSNSE